MNQTTTYFSLTSLMQPFSSYLSAKQKARSRGAFTPVNSISVKIVLAALSISFALATPARAELNSSINLWLVLQSQKDFRWGGFPIGPRNIIVPIDPKNPINIARCGCFITSLSTAVEKLNGGGLPWFASDQFTAEGFISGFYSFSPKYLDDFFNVGPNPFTAPRPTGWGYSAGGGMTCALAVWPWAATGLINPVRDPVTYDPLTPTGLTWDGLGHWDATARNQVDEGLAQGYPSIVIRHTISGKGFHANLIVGWDNTKKMYLIFDPMWDPLVGAQLMGFDFWDPALPEPTDAEKYTNYVKAIAWVDPLRPVLGRSLWFFIRDAPEPIKLRLTDPRGRRTGYDPATGENLQENRTAYYSEFTSWADPLGVLPEADPFRYIAARDPEAGTYGLEVFGIGDGPFTLTLGTVNGDQQQDVTTLIGNITNGETKRYEITYSGPGAITAAAVPAFGPHAKAGNDTSAFIGNVLSFDGRGSYQISGTITAYSWNFGDGTSASGPQQTHAYLGPGSYTATLTVTNAAGLTATDDRTIVVIDPAALPPTETIRVSTTSASAQALGGSSDMEVTPDGRYVAFQSYATNLVSNDTNNKPDIFVKDLITGTVDRVSVGTGGVEATGLGNGSNTPSISADGRFVSFYSDMDNLAPGSAAFLERLYVRDRVSGVTELITQNTTNSGNKSSLSGDGRYLAYATLAGFSVRDRQLGGTDQVFPGRSGRISENGRFIAYVGWNGVNSNISVYDRQTGVTEVVSRTPSGALIQANSYNPAISGDGQYVAFDVDNGAQVVPGTYNGFGLEDVFLRDRLNATTERISVSSTGEGADFGAGSPAISATGRYVSFYSGSDNLAPNGVLHSLQVYRRDRQTHTTERSSVSSTGTAASPELYGFGGHYVIWPAFVASDGSVVFYSTATNLVAADTNGAMDIFMHRPVPGSGGAPATTPLANLGGPYVGWASSAAVPAAIRLDGSGSIDPSNRTLTAHWNFGDGSPVTTAPLVTTHAYAQAGLYQVTLTVSAGGVTSAPAHTEVEVLPALPSAGLSIGACVAPGGTLSLDGAAPTANGTLVANGWDTTTGPIQLAPVTITLPWGQIQLPTMLPGLTFQGTVAVPSVTTDGHYNAAVTSGSTAPFNIPCARSANLRPLAVAGGPIYHAQAGVPLMLDGSSSSDPENAPLSYRWDFGDTTSGSTVTPTHTYAGEGSYFVTLIVNDGVQDSATMIGTRSFAMVVVTANLQTVSHVTYDGSGSTGGSVPTDGNPYVAGATVTVLGNTGSLVKTGYTFAGWNTAANGSGTSYAGGATFAMGSGDVTLYAKWTLTVTSYAVPSIPTLSESAMMALILLLGLAGAYRIRGT